MYFTIWIERPTVVKLDFSAYYAWAQAIRHHIDPYHVDLSLVAQRYGIAIGPIKTANYPPSFLLMIEPLSKLRPLTAYWVWTGITLCLLATTLFSLLYRAELPVRVAIVFASAALLYRPLQCHFEFAQTQVMILSLMVLTMVALRNGREPLAGMAAGFAILVKAYPLILVLYFLARRRWRAIAYAAITVFAGYVLSVLILGHVAWEFFRPVIVNFEPHSGAIMLPKISIPGALLDMYALLSPSRPLLRLVRVLGIAGAMMVVAVVFETVRRAHDDPQSTEHGFGLFVAAMVIVTPNAWPHYMVLLLLPLLQLVVAAYHGYASRTAYRLGILAYIIAEVSYVSAFAAENHGDLAIATVIQEGMFISALMTFAASYLLSRYDQQSVRQDSSRSSFQTQMVTVVPSNLVNVNPLKISL